MNNIEVLESLKEPLAAVAVEQTYRLDPTLMVRYGASGRDKCLQDTFCHIQNLIQALRYSSPLLFTEYVSWFAYLLVNQNIPVQDLHTNLAALGSALKEQVPDLEESVFSKYLQPAVQIINKPLADVDSFIDDSQPHAMLCREYLAALLEGNHKQARQMVLEAVKSGTSVRDIYLYIFQNSQWEVGRLWQQKKITVGQEHFCTAATQSIMSQLYPYTFSGVQRLGKRLVAICVGDELHELGLRMLSDFLEMDGWDTYYLGANVPLESILKAISEPPADVLAISTTMTIHLPFTQMIIDRVHDESFSTGARILVGGYAFNIDPMLWQKVGADGYAVNSAVAVDEARRLVGLAPV